MKELTAKNGRKFYAVLIALLAVIAIAIFAACGRSGGTVTDEEARRSRPKAVPPQTVDAGVLNAGQSAWQGQDFRNAAQNALNIVNQQRASAGLGALQWDDTMASCAMVRAMELPSLFSHTRPNGQDWYTVAPNVMYGENLAYGFSSPESAVNAWMNSPAHKANIMTPNFVSCGIGVYNAGGTWYWSQEFSYF